MKKSKKKYLLVSILALFLAVASNAFAATNSDAEKSVYSWGPWEKMVSPAAGPESLDKANAPISSFSDRTEQVKDDSKDSDSKHE